MAAHPALRRLVPVLLLALACWLPTQVHAIEPGRNTRTDNPVDQATSALMYPLYLGDRLLQIPGSFLTLIGPFDPQRKAYTGSASLQVVFPALEGLTPLTRDIFKGPSRHNSPLVRIEILYNPRYRYNTAIDYLKDVAGDSFTPKGIAQPAGVLDLHQFEPQQIKPARYEYLYQELQDGQYFVAQCTLPAASLIDTCNVSRLLTGNVILRYHFPKSLLKDWRTLDRGVVELIKGFAARPSTNSPR
ncbi:MAG: hypothetical protein C0428_03930 [Polaromonas sp.]|nr:hypothetical protein [Polaromonas sp.]